jgi:hypothetical protein
MPGPSSLRGEPLVSPEGDPELAHAHDTDAIMQEADDVIMPTDEAVEPHLASEPESEELAAPPPSDPRARVLHRRTSSATAPTQLPPSKKLASAASKTGIPPPKTALTERPANVVANRRRLR